MRIKSILLSLSAIAALSAGGAHAAATNLVTNGNFELTTNGNNKQLSASVLPSSDSDAAKRTTLTGWTSSNGTDGGYNFVLNSSIINTASSVISLKNQYANNTSNGFTASANGGNVFASDALYHPGTLSQTISGLTVGSAYTLTFDYALGQQSGFSGANTNDYWEVVFGSTVKDTAGLSIVDSGFSGWKSASMTFTATGVNEVLSFLAKTNASGAPPFMLLDSVSMTAAVPEPSTWGMLLGGLGLVGLARRRAAKRA